MVFNSIEEVITYIENIIPGVLNECSYDMQEIMINEIMEQVYIGHSSESYPRTGQLLDSPQMVDINNNSVTMEFVDNGDWHSVFPPHEHMFAFAAEEAGTVWDKGTNSNTGEYKYKPATNIHEVSVNRCKAEIPPKLKEYLISMGIPIE